MTSHRAGAPPTRVGSSFSPSSQDSNPHHPRGFWGGRGALGGWVNHSPSHGRTALVAQASCPLGAVAAGTPAGCAASYGITRARPAVGAGGAQAWWTFLAPSRPRSLQRCEQKGQRVNPLLPGIASCRGLQGGFELGRPQLPPHPSANRGSRVLQGRIWGSSVLQGVLCCRHKGSQRLLLWVRGVRVKDRVVHLSPWRGAAQPPPPPPSVGGQGGHRCAAMRQGGAEQQLGQTVSGAPRSTRARQPGGLLSLGFTRQVQPSGGGRPTPHSRTCGRGRGSTKPEIWAGSLLGGSHVGWRPRSFRRAMIRWGAWGVRAFYICIYIPLIYTPLPNSRWLHHTALRYVPRAQLGAYMWWKGLNSVKTGSKWAKTTCFSIPNGPGSLLEKRVFDPFLTHFWSQNGPFSRHFGIFYGPKHVNTGSKWAKNTCLSIPNGPGSLLKKHVFDPFLTIFCPKTTHFQGILGFSMAQYASPRAQNGLKTLV